MAEATPFALSQLFSDLTGRRVAVAAAAAPAAAATKKIVAVYNVLPDNYTIVLKTDVAFLGSLGGALMGMPDAIVQQRLKESPLDEALRDAMHEVLNITSSVVTTEGRAILKQMEADPARGDALYDGVARGQHYKSHFQATMAGYQGGAISILTQI